MARGSGIGQDELRRVNLSAVLSRVHASGPTSRAALTAELGLNRSTIGDLTAQLDALGLVSEMRPTQSRGAGRPSHLVVPRQDVTVVAVQDISSEDFVERDLMLIKVRTTPQQRVEITLMVEMFRGRVVDISPETLMIEISGQERKIEAFIDLMRPYGIVELARTGRIALVRGTSGKGDVL